MYLSNWDRSSLHQAHHTKHLNKQTFDFIYFSSKLWLQFYRGCRRFFLLQCLIKIKKVCLWLLLFLCSLNQKVFNAVMNYEGVYRPSVFACSCVCLCARCDAQLVRDILVVNLWKAKTNQSSLERFLVSDFTKHFIMTVNAVEKQKR